MSNCNSASINLNQYVPTDATQPYLPVPGWPYPAPRDVCPGCGRCSQCGRGGSWFPNPWWGIYPSTISFCGAH